MVTNNLDFLTFLAFLISESFVYFLSNGYCYKSINPMNYHGPDVHKQHILSSPLLAILVALVTVFILRDFSKNTFLCISLPNDMKEIQFFKFMM